MALNAELNPGASIPQMYKPVGIGEKTEIPHSGLMGSSFIVACAGENEYWLHLVRRVVWREMERSRREPRQTEIA